MRSALHRWKAALIFKSDVLESPGPSGSQCRPASAEFNGGPTAKQRVSPGDTTDADSESDAEAVDTHPSTATNDVWRGPDPRPKATVRGAAVKLTYAI